MEADGIEKFYSQLGINAENDTITFLISFYMNAEAMGSHSFEEFTNAFKNVGATTMEEFKRNVPTLKTQWREPARFKEVYKFIFDFTKEAGYKNLSMENAIALWEMILADKCQFLKDWIEFITTQKQGQLVVTRDTWNMVLELIEQTQGDFGRYVDDGAWPLMID